MGFNKRLISSEAAAASAGILVAATSGGLYVSTDDGDTWTQSGISNNFATSAQSVTYNGTYFHAIGNDGGTNRAKYSTDGLSWTNSTTTFTYAGIDITSDSSTGTVVISVAYTNGGEVWTSTNNGSSYTRTYNNPTGQNARVYSAADDNSNEYVCGMRGQQVLRGSGGSSWTLDGSIGTSVSQMTSMGYSNGRFIGAGQGAAYSTDNGDTFTDATGINTSVNTEAGGLGVGADGSGNIVIGFYSTNGTGQIYYSSDNGSSYQASTTSPFSTSGGRGKGAVYHNGKFIVGSSNSQGIAISTDNGVNFSSATTSPSETDINRIASSVNY